MLSKLRDILLILVAAVFLMAITGQGDITLVHGFNGSKPVPFKADLSTRGQVIVDYEHHEIHDGGSFFATDTATLNDGNTRELLIETPNTTVWSHFCFLVTGSLETTVELFETSTKTTGTAMTEYNRNRNNGNSTTVVITHTPGGAGDGNLIFKTIFGNDAGPPAGGGLGGQSRPEHEIVLGQNETYLIKITSGTNANNITTLLSWYDHTDEN